MDTDNLKPLPSQLDFTWLLSSCDYKVSSREPYTSNNPSNSTKQHALINDFIWKSRLETWKYVGDLSTQTSLTKQPWCSILMGVSAYTMGAMATARGVPDWIWLSGQQGWARQMRTPSPDCVRVCTCVHVAADIECKQYRERMLSMLHESMDK